MAQGAFVELRITEQACETLLVEQPLRFEVHDGGVVLMEAADEHSFRNGSGGLSQHQPPALVRIVANLAPINADDYDRRSGSRKNNPVSEQRINNLTRRLNHACEQTMPEWRRDVSREMGKFEHGGRR